MFRLAHTSRRRIVRTAIFTTALVLSLACDATQTPAHIGDCGQPISAGDSPVATDALFVLSAAVGTQFCEACVCDVNDDGAVTATDALIDLSAAVGQAVSLDCSSCAIECPQDEGCELSDGMVEEGEPLMLETSGGQVMVPADALPAGIVVTLREATPDLADSLPDGPGEELLSNIFDVTFSDAVQPTAPIALDVSVPDPAPMHFRGRLKVMGIPFPTEATEESWQIYVGRFDKATSRLAFTLLGASDHMSAAVVVPLDEGASVTRRATSKSVAPIPSSSATAQTVELGANGWAVVCLPLLYTLLNPEDTSCDPDAFASLVAGEFRDAGAFIKALGLTNARLATSTRADLERSLLTVGYADAGGVPDNSPSAEYNVAAIMPLVEAGVAGDYSSATGYIRISVTSGFLTEDQSDTIAHELMHAVQYGTAPGVVDAGWILEGVADAIGHGFVLPDPQARVDYRRDDIWRDWNLALNTTDGGSEYRTSELWFSAGAGDLNYLEPFYESLAMISGTSDTQSYMQANDAFFWSLPGGGLADQYITLLQDRDEGDDYPYCTSISCSPGSSCRTDHQDTMSAKCFNVTVSAPDCPDDPSTLTLEVEQPGLAGAMKFMVAGQVYAAGQAVEVTEQVRVWPINDFYEDQNDIFYSIVAENNCGCGDGEKTEGEECDDGNNESGDRCSSECLNECGDGVVQGVCTAGMVGEICIRDGHCTTEDITGVCDGEECDDGNNEAGDGCSPTCEDECGNGTIDSGEECDDGNRVGGDGCSSICLPEPDCTMVASGPSYLCQNRCCSIDQDCNIGGTFFFRGGQCITRPFGLCPRPEAGAGPIGCISVFTEGQQEPDRIKCCSEAAGCVVTSPTKVGCGSEPE
jgi:cysteine-rich repeat protein